MTTIRGVHWSPHETETDPTLVQAEPWPFMTTTTFSQPLSYQNEQDYSDDEDQSDSDLDDETALNQLYARNQSLSTAPPEITHERLEWQQMLQSVLMGEVIKSEKKRLSSTDKFQFQKPTQEIWLSLRALLRGRTLTQEKKFLEDSRKEIQGVLKMVMDFKVKKEQQENALREVAEVLKNVDRIESLYTTRAEMIQAHPNYGKVEFQTKLDALNSWCTITRSLTMQYKILRNWTGSEDLQISRSVDTDPNTAHNDPSFVERLLKESALQDTFDKRTLSALNSLLVKSKETMIMNAESFEEMGLPSFISQLRQLAYFPTSLVEEALKLRLEYKDRMNEPPKQMVDAMMEDYRGLLALACRVKMQYEELTHPEPGWHLYDTQDPVDHKYDHVLLESIRFYFKLITYKLDLEKENNLRECEVMEKEWEFLKGTVCQTVDNADWECAQRFW
jgi:mitogen-activated protein kinase kinase kinase